VLGLLISSAMVISLYLMLTQTRRVVGRINEVINLDLPAMALYSQMEKDITGMFAPKAALNYYISQEEQKGKEQKTQTQGSQDKSKTQKTDKSGSDRSVPEKQQDAVLEIDQKTNEFLFSFITTGAIATIDKDG